jgi:hypothetical protein
VGVLPLQSAVVVSSLLQEITIRAKSIKMVAEWIVDMGIVFSVTIFEDIGLSIT